MATPDPVPSDYLPDDALLLRRSRAARFLDISDATMQRLISSGEVPSVKIGSSRRIARADLDAYVEQLRGRTAGRRP